MPEPLLLPRLALGVLAAALALGGTAALSHFPTGAPATHAELRLALRTAAARIQTCRDRSAEELAALPAHLRAPQVCDEAPIDFRLTVAIDGAPQLDRVVTHRGVRRTRPLTVDEALPVAPGPHRVEIRFEPRPAAAGDKANGEAFREAVSHLAAPHFDETIDFAAGRARMVRLDADGALELAPEPPRLPAD